MSSVELGSIYWKQTCCIIMCDIVCLHYVVLCIMWMKLISSSQRKRDDTSTIAVCLRYNNGWAKLFPVSTCNIWHSCIIVIIIIYCHGTNVSKTFQISAGECQCSFAVEDLQLKNVWYLYLLHHQTHKSNQVCEILLRSDSTTRMENDILFGSHSHCVKEHSDANMKYTKTDIIHMIGR